MDTHEWEERAEGHLRPWLRETVTLAHTMEYIIENCDTVSKGFLMHAAFTNLMYFFVILHAFKERYVVDQGTLSRPQLFSCIHPSRCLVTLCREIYPELYEDDVWHV